jgi:parallel beta-helix repeat protein
MKNIDKFRFFLRILILFLVAFLFDCSKPTSPDNKNSRPQIEVKSPITADAIWESGKDYLVHGEVVVEQNVMLTIEKDVNVYLGLDSLGNKGKLHVKGRVKANGEDSTTAIVFQPETGDSKGDGSWGVEIDENNNPSFFMYCNFINCHYGISSVQNRIIIDNCSFEACDMGISISKCDSVFISNSNFTSNSFGVKIELSEGLKDSCIIISGNKFVNCTSSALEVSQFSDALVEDNFFINCATGVICLYYSNCKLIYNDFKNCLTGIGFSEYSKGEIKKNVIENCDLGIYVYRMSNPNINWNNLLFCKSYKIIIFLYVSEMIINAENNWWGTNDESSINQAILDENDFSTDLSRGFVDFIPYESGIIKDCGVRKIKKSLLINKK